MRFSNELLPERNGQSGVNSDDLAIRNALGRPVLEYLQARGLNPEAIVEQLGLIPESVRHEAIQIIARNARREGGASLVTEAGDDGQPKTTTRMRWKVYRRR